MFVHLWLITLSFVLISSPGLAESDHSKKSCPNMFRLAGGFGRAREMTLKQISPTRFEILIDGWVFFRITGDKDQQALILEWQRYADLHVMREFTNELLTPKPLLVSAPYLSNKESRPGLTSRLPLAAEAAFDDDLDSNLARVKWSCPVTYIVQDGTQLVAHLTATLTSPRAEVDIFSFKPNWKLTFPPHQLKDLVFTQALTTLMDKATTAFVDREIRWRFYRYLQRIARTTGLITKELPAKKSELALEWLQEK